MLRNRAASGVNTRNSIVVALHWCAPAQTLLPVPTQAQTASKTCLNIHLDRPCGVAGPAPLLAGPASGPNTRPAILRWVLIRRHAENLADIGKESDALDRSLPSDASQASSRAPRRTSISFLEQTARTAAVPARLGRIVHPRSLRGRPRRGRCAAHTPEGDENIADTTPRSPERARREDCALGGEDRFAVSNAG